MSKKYSAEEIKEAHAALRKRLKPGMKVYTVLRHCSASGMSRRISCFIITKRKSIYGGGHEPECLDWYIERIGLFSRHKDKEGLSVGGCGMDMGFHVVYSLSRAVFPKGFKLKKGEYGRNGDTSGYDNDGGYALKQAWL